MEQIYDMMDVLDMQEVEYKMFHSSLLLENMAQEKLY